MQQVEARGRRGSYERGKMMWRLLVGMLLMVGCEKAPPKAVAVTPEAAYLGFAESLERRDSAAAYQALSKGTRGHLEARTRAIADASAGLIPDAPARVLFESGSPARSVSELTVKVLERTENEATLEVTSPGGTQKVKMVREAPDERWAVDLAALF